MRRALMTMRPFGGAPFTVGSPATSRASANSGDLQMNLNNPAPNAGTITSASCYLTGVNPSDLRFFTGTWDGTTFTVTAATGNLGGVSGLNTFTVSLAIPAGGHIGVYQVGASLSLDTTGGSAVRLTTSAVPTAGTTYTGMASATWIVSVEGSGS